MWKKRLIVAVTFIAGLYYFLEFVVPPTIPWKTMHGIVVSANPTSIQLRIGHSTRTERLSPNMVIYRDRSAGSPERIDNAATLKPGEKVSIGPTTYISGWVTGVNNFFVVLGTMAWGMGLFSLWMVHSSNIRKRKEEWFGSVLFFIAVIGGIIAGLGSGAQSGFYKQACDVVVNDMMRPMGSTVFSLLAFYMASAAYRAFKIASKESALMMASAFIVMLGQIPIGLWLTHGLPQWLWLPVLSQWILYIANSAAVRGMFFGMMLGAIAVGLRFWLSLERGSFFDTEL